MAGDLGTAYAALAGGDREPLLGLLGDDFEWVEPELPGYPLAGVHVGPAGVEGGVLDPLEATIAGLAFEVAEVVDAGERTIVTGTLRGTPAGADAEWELPFAHVWELSGDRPVRVRTYFDRSRLTVAAARRQLADVADDLLDQAAEIRRQWARLGDALRAAGVESEGALEELEGEEEPSARAGSASARLAAVDMAEEGASREEVEAYLRDDLGVEDPAPILDEVFGPVAEAGQEALDERAAALEATRLSRLFARNRN